MLCCDIAKEKYGDFDAQRYGRRGQKQWGVDIIARDRRSTNERIVIQCKFRSHPFLFKGRVAARERVFVQSELLAELNAALDKHQFDKFIFASNDITDAVMQD